MGSTMKNVMSWRFFVCVLLAQLAHIHAGNVVPVMLWYGETSSGLVNPLHKTTRPEFEGILAERLGKGQPPMMVFVKDNFCAEDIKHHKESLQQLNNAGSLTFLPSVEFGLSVFENLSSYNVTIGDDLESVPEGQLVLVQVTDLNAIPEIYNMVKESSPNLIVALTGKSCGYSSSERIKRQALPRSDSSHLIINDDKRIRFYADKPPSIKFDDKEWYPLPHPSTPVFVDPTGYSMKLSFTVDVNGLQKISLTTQFEIAHGYFNFIGFKYADENTTEPIFLRSRRQIVYPFNTSYHCQQDNYFTYKNKDKQISVKIQNLQIQMDTLKFGEVYDCVGFMSIPIWTGIFVTSILALIMIWGLIMIMDIRTMDRFDDPKGKTITISAQE